MNLTTHAFKQLMRPGGKAGVEWTDEPTRADHVDPDNPAWAVWESACGEYRVVFDGTTDTFSPQVKRLGHVGVEWSPVSPDCRDLGDAQRAVQEVHRA